MSSNAAQPMPAADAIRRMLPWALLVLVGLCVLAFRSQVSWSIHFASISSEGAHLFAAPVLIGLLLWRRRDLLAASAAAGSWWGLPLVLLSLATLAIAQWPFNFAMPQRMAFVPALAGCILIVCGWRFLWHALPVLALVLTSVPIGHRYYEFLVTMVEALTLRGAATVLELLPGVDLVDLNGIDLLFVGPDGPGTIALAEPHRGASLLIASLMIALFVVFWRVRRKREIVALALLSVPVILLCNLLRLLTWGVTSIYFGASAVSGAPRLAGAIVSMTTAWILMSAAGGLVGWTPGGASTRETEPCLDRT